MRIGFVALASSVSTLLGLACKLLGDSIHVFEFGEIAKQRAHLLTRDQRIGIANAGKDGF